MADTEKCHICDLHFARGCALSSHLWWVHEVKNEYRCDICNKTFLHKKGFVMHEKMHNADRSSATCPICHVKLPKRELIRHFSESHNIQMEEETLQFESMVEFRNWKKKIEGETISSFINKSSTIKTKSGATTIYVCHRDGTYTPKGKNMRAVKAIGSNKINGHCPAKLVVRTSLDGLSVNFVKTHVGHSMDLGRILISKEEKETIAQKIASRVPLDEILDEIRDSLQGNNLERKHLITRKDLHNIAHRYNISKETVLLQSESVSVDKWVEHMQATKNLVRLYKPQGALIAEYPGVQENDFFLILANDKQLDMLTSYGNCCICVDGTNGLISYDFELYTIMILDDLNQAFPCAFLFSNRGDAVAMEIFFHVIKNSMGRELHPKYFMSDMDNSFYTAWCSVMPHNNTSRLFCSWHLDRAWRTNLSRICRKSTQAKVYLKLRDLMQEIDIGSFYARSTNLLQEFYTNLETQNYAEYIEPFINDPSPWAYCFRQNSGIDTNIALENMHQVMNHLYLRGKKAKRLDRGINALMRFLKDKMFDRLITLHKGKVTHQLCDLRSRHKSSLDLLADTCTIHESNGVWTIPSSDKLFEHYEVTRGNADCDCALRCEDCCACIHSLKCSCVDYTIKWNMCKHMHWVGEILKQQAAHAFTSSEEHGSSVSDGMENVGDAQPHGIDSGDQQYVSERSEHESRVEYIVTNRDMSSDCVNHDKSLGFVEHVENEDALYTNSKSESVCESLSETKDTLLKKVRNIIQQIGTKEEAEAFQNFLAPMEEAILSVKKRNLPEDSAISSEPSSKKKNPSQTQPNDDLSLQISLKSKASKSDQITLNVFLYED